MTAPIIAGIAGTSQQEAATRWDAIVRAWQPLNQYQSQGANGESVTDAQNRPVRKCCSLKRRRGGYVIDFGLVGYDIAEKMGLIPRLRELGYQVREMRFVDREGRTSASMSVDALARLTHGRFITLRRSDLAATIYGALDGTVETIFGDSVASIEEAGACVRVGFDHALPREADLVIGADGLHSRVRQLVFGSDTGVEVSLGYHVAAFEVEGYRPRDELAYLGYGVPGRQIYRFSMREDKTLFLFIFRDEYLPAENPANDQERKSVLTNVFADVGWE